MTDGSQQMDPRSTTMRSGFNFLLARWIDGLPPAYAGITLQSCIDLPREARNFGAQWATQQHPMSLYLHGPYGSGKTTFAFALVREYLRHWTTQRYAWASFMTARQLDSRLLEAIRGDGDSWLLERYGHEELLFLDDIDKVTPSDRFKSQMFEIINYRLMNNLPTIITSNCEPDELASLFDGSILSRMKDKARWNIIRFPDKDLRQVKS